MKKLPWFPKLRCNSRTADRIIFPTESTRVVTLRQPPTSIPKLDKPWHRSLPPSFRRRKRRNGKRERRLRPLRLATKSKKVMTRQTSRDSYRPSFITQRRPGWRTSIDRLTLKMKLSFVSSGFKRVVSQAWLARQERRSRGQAAYLIGTL